MTRGIRSVYNGHLRGPVTPTPIAERLAVKLSLPVLTTYVCRVLGVVKKEKYGNNGACIFAVA